MKPPTCPLCGAPLEDPVILCTAALTKTLVDLTCATDLVSTLRKIGLDVLVVFGQECPTWYIVEK